MCLLLAQVVVTLHGMDPTQPEAVARLASALVQE